MCVCHGTASLACCSTLCSRMLGFHFETESLSVDQAGLELSEICLPLPPSRVLGLKVCTLPPSFVCFVFKSGSLYVAMGVLEFMQTRLASNSFSSACLCLLIAGTEDLQYNSQPNLFIFMNGFACTDVCVPCMCCT